MNFRICLSLGSSKSRTKEKDSVLVLHTGGERGKPTGGSGDSDRGGGEPVKGMCYEWLLSLWAPGAALCWGHLWKPEAGGASGGLRWALPHGGIDFPSPTSPGCIPWKLPWPRESCPRKWEIQVPDTGAGVLIQPLPGQDFGQLRSWTPSSQGNHKHQIKLACEMAQHFVVYETSCWGTPETLGDRPSTTSRWVPLLSLTPWRADGGRQDSGQESHVWLRGCLLVGS